MKLQPRTRPKSIQKGVRKIYIKKTSKRESNGKKIQSRLIFSADGAFDEDGRGGLGEIDLAFQLKLLCSAPGVGTRADDAKDDDEDNDESLAFLSPKALPPWRLFPSGERRGGSPAPAPDAPAAPAAREEVGPVPPTLARMESRPRSSALPPGVRMIFSSVGMLVSMGLYVPSLLVGDVLRERPRRVIRLGVLVLLLLLLLLLPLASLLASGLLLADGISDSSSSDSVSMGLTLSATSRRASRRIFLTFI